MMPVLVKQVSSHNLDIAYEVVLKLVQAVF